MNELSEFFKTVSIEKTRVAEERKRFTPRVEIKETDLSDFFGTIKTGQQNQVILAQREGTKLDSLQSFFTRLQSFEDSLKEQMPGTTDNPIEGSSAIMNTGEIKMSEDGSRVIGGF